MTTLSTLRFITLPLIIALLVTAAGCHHSLERTIVRPELPPEQGAVFMSVILDDSTEVIFNDEGGAIEAGEDGGRHGPIVGRTSGGRAVTIAQDRVLAARLQIRSYNGVGTLAVAGLVLLVTTFFATVGGSM